MIPEAAARKDAPAEPAGEVGYVLREAYRALTVRDLATAAKLANSVAKAQPGNVHPWLILGIAALDRMEGATAQAFFQRALEIAPGSPDGLSGLGKALVLQADAFGAVAFFEQAMAAGSDDLSMIQLYKELMCRMDRRAAAAEAIGIAAARMQSAALFTTVGELYLDAEQYGEALAAFDAAAALDPDALMTRLSMAKAMLFRHDFEGVEAATGVLLAAHPELDELVSLRMSALRNLGRHDEALAMLDAPFRNVIYFKRALGVSAHIHLDRGDTRAAGLAFRNAYCLTDQDGTWAAKSYGTHCLAEGDFSAGVQAYAGRQLPANRAKIPYEMSAPENLRGRSRLFLMQEQGIGDQLAFLPLCSLAPLAGGCEVVFVGEARMQAVLADNRLGIGFRDEARFDTRSEAVTRSEVIFLGDLVRFLPERRPDQRLGGYLTPDPERVAACRTRYRELAQGKPIVGLAWRSGDRLTGSQRSVALADLVACLPPGALAVNLQYGDVRAELEAAAAARPDVTLYDDPAVDQLTDLGAFLAQIAALDRVVTIDNTTAHACGALGHPDAHLLLPAGAECMWYWRRKGAADPWYGSLRLHRQAAPREWSRPLAEIAALPPLSATWPDRPV